MYNLHSSLLLLAKIFHTEPSMKADREMLINICLSHNLPEKRKTILRVKLPIIFFKERSFWPSAVFPLWKTKTLEAKGNYLPAYVPQNLPLKTPVYSGAPDYLFSNRMQKDCNPNHSRGSCEEGASRNGSSSSNPANNSSQSSSSQHTRNSTPQLHPSFQVAQFSGTNSQLHLFPGRRVL